MKMDLMPSLRLRAAATLVGAFILASIAVDAQPYRRNVLLEEGTATWCGWCPYASWALDSIRKNLDDHAVLLAWHNDELTPAGQFFYNNTVVDTLSSLVDYHGFPFATIGRARAVDLYDTIWTTEDFWYQQAYALAVQESPVDLRILNMTYAPDSRTVEFDVDLTPYDLTTLPKEQGLHYVLFAALTEDSVIAAQSKSPEEIMVEDFHQNNVVRRVAGRMAGDPITLGTVTPLAHYPVRRHFSLAVDSAWNPRWIRAKVFAAAEPDDTTEYQSVLDARESEYLSEWPASTTERLHLILPRPNDTIAPEASVRIIWSREGNGGPDVRLDYSTDDGATWTPAVDRTETSPLDWTLPEEIEGTDLLLRASDPDDEEVETATRSFHVRSRPSGTDVEPSAPLAVRVYPNPFGRSTTIEYSLRRRGAVSLTVRDLLGNVAAATDGTIREAGIHRERFDGSSLPDGLYVYTLRADGRELNGIMSIVR